MEDDPTDGEAGRALLARGRQRRRAQAHDEATELLSRAGELLAGARAPEEAVIAWRLAASSASEAGDAEASEGTLVKAIALARQARLPKPLAAALGELGTLMSRTGRSKEASSLHQEALEIATRIADPAGVATHTGNLGLLSFARGDLAAARDQLTRAMEVYLELGQPGGAGTSLNALGGVERASGEPEAAREAFSAAEAMFRRAGSPRGLATALANLGNLARGEGRLDEAASYFEESLVLARDAGDAAGEARALTDMANVAAARGARGKARRWYEQAAGICERRGFSLGLAGAQVNLGSLLFEEGAVDEARAAWEGAALEFGRGGDLRAEVDVRCLVAQLDGRRGALAAAEKALANALEAARALSYDEAAARIEVNLAALGFAAGRVEAAALGFSAGAAFFSRRGRPFDEVSCRLAAVEALLAAGRVDAAVEEVGRAATVVEPLDAPGVRCEVEAMTARVRLAEAPTEASALKLASAADMLDEAGRPLEALGHRLSLVESAGPRASRLELAQRLWAQARGLSAVTAALDAESLCLALGPPSQPASSRLEEAASEAEACRARLLALRIRRRRLAVLLALGQEDDARALRIALQATARDLGAGAESARLDS